MELRQLKYFITSADTLNFTEAARLCYITQSTLSQQIKQLETELGVQLFERIGKRVFLTETGRDFLPYARQTVADFRFCCRYSVGDMPKCSLTNLPKKERLGKSSSVQISLIVLLL